MLGGFRAQLPQGPDLPLRRKKTQALLAYLASRPGQPALRDKLAALLWGDTTDGQARHSLRQTIFELRRALPRPIAKGLMVDGEHLALAPGTAEVDAVTFACLVADGSPAALTDAVRLYQGDFLEGLAVDAAPFEDWIRIERERLHETALEACARLLANQMDAEDVEPAIQTALRLLALDPLQEVAHRTLMRLYVRQGRRAAALRQYQLCVDVLQREFGVEPEDATSQLYQEILPATASHAVMSAAPRDSGVDGAHGNRVVASRPRPRRRRRTISLDMPLIGRDAELETLDRALRDAWQRRGTVAVVVGEAGVGKTRLAGEIAAIAARRDGRVVLARAYETARTLPLALWADALRDALDGTRDALNTFHPAWRPDLARLLPDLVDPDVDRIAVTNDPVRLFEAVTQLVGHLAARQPLLLVLEDVQWADEMSVALLAYVGRRLVSWPVLLVVTAREEDLPDAAHVERAVAELQAEARFVRLTLPALSRRDTRALARALAPPRGGSGSMDDVEAHVWLVSEGNPFLAVETIRASAEGAAAAEPLALPFPRRIVELVGARLDRLSEPSRHLLAIASVIGRDFDFRLLQHAAGMDDRSAAAAVEELVRRRIFHAAGDNLDFSHDRIRAVAYHRMPRTQRALLHRVVASAMEAVYAQDLSPHYAGLASHSAEGELWDRAVIYLRGAGAEASRRSALGQSGDFLEQALAALVHVPDTDESRALAFDIRLELRTVLVLLGDLRRALALLREAETLAERFNDDRRKGHVLSSMMNIHSQLGELEEAVASGTRALEIARALGDAELCVLTTSRLEQAYYFRGDYERVVELATENVATLAAGGISKDIGSGVPASVYDRNWLVQGLAQLGRFAEAARVDGEAIRLAEPTHHAYTVSVAYGAAGVLRLLRGDWAAARTLIERRIAEVRTGNVALTLPWAIAYSAWALAQLGEVDQAQNRLREGEQLLEHQAARGIVGQGTAGYLALGRACLALGCLDEARRLANCAIAWSPGHQGFIAHARHLLGDVATHADRFDAESGETYYREALALAEPRGMRPLVAHCHFGLGRLYRHCH